MSSTTTAASARPELMVDGRRVHVVRRRERLDDQLGLERTLP